MLYADVFDAYSLVMHAFGMGTHDLSGCKRAFSGSFWMRHEIPMTIFHDDVVLYMMGPGTALAFTSVSFGLGHLITAFASQILLPAPVLILDSAA